MITIDGHDTIKLINPAACGLFGYEPREVIGQKMAMLMPQGQKAIKGLKINGLKKNGVVFPCQLELNEILLPGKTIYAGFIRDLSLENETEERLNAYAVRLEGLVEERTVSLEIAAQALRLAQEELSNSLKREIETGFLKSYFISIASHEIRTPLTLIQLSAYLIDKYAEPYNNQHVKKHTDKIKNAISDITDVLNDFLSLGKLEKGKEKPSISWFDLVKLAEDITAEMQLITKENQFINYKHTGINSMVNLDPDLVKNCITNLLTNAIKYSGENTCIEFTTGINKRNWIITVSDNGIGIPAADQPHLFEPFFRAQNVSAIAGTGVGLNLVSRYVNLMNGKIDFKSELKQGTVFTICFPVSD